jgi:hypothetical protein
MAQLQKESMMVRGKAIVVIPAFIKKKFGEEGLIYWLHKITPQARRVYDAKIDVNQWFPLKEILLEPTANVAGLFYGWNLQKAAWELGRYSADYRFAGVGKILIKFPSPNFFVSKGVEYLPDYYRPCRLVIKENSDGKAIVQVTYFPEIDKTTEYRIGGWIERGLEMNGCKDLKVDITKYLTHFDPCTEYTLHWRPKSGKR